MAIIDSKKVDYLWKKIGYGSAKTDTNANKKAPNEAISSPLLLNGTNTWNRADQIPGTQPASSAGVVTVYPTSNPIECTEDNTATQYRTWKTGQTDWIPPEFGSTYQAKVYIHTSSDAAGATGGTQVFATGSGNDDEWFFDYQAGILHFIGTNLPNGVSFSGKSVYIAASRYTGTKGLESIYSYIDSQVSASGTLTIADDGSTTSAVELDNTVQFLGGNNISTTVSGATITFTGATDINVNSITSTDSSAIQINDHANISGNLTVAGDLTADGSSAVQDLRVRGNLTVDGTQTILNTSTLSVEDNILVLNRNVSGSPNADAGIEIERGDEANKTLIWDETTDKWTVGSETFVAGTFEGNLTGNADTATSMANVITVVGDDSTGTTLNSQETFKIAGNTNITTAVSGDTLTITGSKDININSITSDDSTAIQINDGLNVAGNIDVQGNTVTGLGTPSADSDAATKAYVDTRISANNSLTVGGDDSSEITLDLDTSLNVKGGTNISTSVAGDTLTITGATDLTVNSLESADSTAIQINDGLNVAGNIDMQGNGIIGVVDPSNPQDVATKAYVDAQNQSQALTFVGDDSTGTAVNSGETFKIAGTQNITTAVSGDTLTITGPDLSSYATQSYVTSQGYITNSTTTIVGDDSTGTTLNSGETFKIAGGNNITTSVDNDVLSIQGATDINVNSITSTDSSAIQVNDGLNVAGNIDVQGNTVTGLGTPSADADAATKAYVDSQVSASNSLTIGGDDSSEITLDLDTALNTVGAGGISTTVSGDTLTITLDNTGVVANTYGSSTEIPQITVDAQGRITNIGTNTISTTLTVSDDTSTEASIALGTDSLQILGGNNISTQISGSTITVVGSTDINVNSITSTDSSAIQLNDHLNVSGNVTIAGDLTADGSSAVQDLRVRGNLTVDGTQTILNTSTLSVEDNILVLNRNVSGSPTADAGIEIERGDEANKTLIWDETTDKWTVGSETFVAGTVEINALDVNEISSSDSSAIQIGNAVNVAGNIDVQGNTVTGLGTPSADTDAATKAYVDSQVSASNSLTIGGDDSSEITLDLDTTLNVKGGTGITTSVEGDTLTITGVNQASGISFGDTTSSTISIPDGGVLNLAGAGGITATVSGDTLTIDGSAVSADLGDFTFSGNKLSTTSSNADFEIDTAGTGEVVMSNSSSLILPKGTVAERPATATAGAIRYNTTFGKYEVSEDGVTWKQITTGAEKPHDNMTHSTKEYNKLTTSLTVIDEFDKFEYAGVFYHVSIEDVSNNLVGQVNINVVRDFVDTYHVVYDKNEDSSNLVNWSTNLDGNTVQLIAQANAESSHVNLKIQRINVGYYESVHFLTNGKAVRVDDITSVSTTVDNFDSSIYQSAKYYAVFRDIVNNQFEVKELLVTHDNTNAYITGYGNVSTTSSSLVEYSATLANNSVIISAQTNGGEGTVLMYRMDLGIKTHLGTYNNVNYRLIGDVDATNTTTIDSFEVASRKTAKYLVSLYNTDSATSQLSEISVIHDGSTASFSEVSVGSSATIGNFTTDISGGKVRLRFQGSGYNNTQVIFARFEYEVPTFYKANADTTGSIYASGSGALHLPSGTTAQRPSPTPGVIRFNTSTSQYEVSADGSSWQALKTQSYTRAVTKDVFAGDGSTQTFTSANVATDAENLLVYIDGVIQEPDINYTIDIPASTITITDEAPHSGARVVVIRGFAEDVPLS